MPESRIANERPRAETKPSVELVLGSLILGPVRRLLAMSDAR
jgi:hypothetical protein